MTIEIEYSNPTGLTLGEWNVQLAKDVAAQASAGTPVGGIGEVEREVQGGTLIVRLRTIGTMADLSDSSLSGFKTAIENHLPNAVHVETREV